MEKELPRAKTAGKEENAGSEDTPLELFGKKTKVARDAAPGEHDASWDELGNTRLTGAAAAAADAEPSNGSLNSPSNYTEMSPNRVLGKDIKELGDFKLIRKLGEGAMGAVYKARQTTYNRVVALKILFSHVANNPKLVQRLYREGLVMGQLDHPNIVQAFGIYEAQGFHYVAMEYVSGQSMQKWLGQVGRIPVADAVRITLDCARALAYAHSLNMVHRDIKPDNILLTRKGVVKVADLGMVKKEDEEMSLTQTGHAVGTPWYMPLEQARNAKEIDGRADIYALGCTLYAYVTGHPPFGGRTIVDVIKAKEIGTFPPARQSNSDVPERLDLILAKMTSKHPKNRYQSCDEVIKDLESLNLASEKLAFLDDGSAAAEVSPEEFDAMGKTNITSPAKSRADVDYAASAAPTLDPDVWFLQMKMLDGTMETRKYTTAMLFKMLEEGMIKPTAKASHQPTEGFRTLGTYKELQGVALGTLAKKAADKNTARYRGLYKKIEEKELEREKEEQQRLGLGEETTMDATRRYWIAIAWKYLPYGVGALIFIIFIYFLSGFWGM